MQLIMKFFFDYIFYRVARFYFKWDKRHAITAVIAVTMIQTLLVMDLTGFIIRLFYNRYVLQDYVQITKFICLTLYFGLLIMNYLKYKGEYAKCKAYWKEETESKQFYRGLLVLFSLLIPWIPIILMAL
jgi:hypothetical protein